MDRASASQAGPRITDPFGGRGRSRAGYLLKARYLLCDGHNRSLALCERLTALCRQLCLATIVALMDRQ